MAEDLAHTPVDGIADVSWSMIESGDWRKGWFLRRVGRETVFEVVVKRYIYREGGWFSQYKTGYGVSKLA